MTSASGLQRLLLLAAPGAGGRGRCRERARSPALGRLGRESATVVAPGAAGPVVTLLSRVQRPAPACGAR